MIGAIFMRFGRAATTTASIGGLTRLPLLPASRTGNDTTIPVPVAIAVDRISVLHEAEQGHTEELELLAAFGEASRRAAIVDNQHDSVGL